VKELCYKEFGKLETLDLGTNKITEIPIALVHFMRNLTQLTLINNDLEKLPPLLGNHKKIKSLTIEGNPLKTIRRPVIIKGNDAIMGNLIDKFIAGRDDVVEQWALERAKAAEDYSQDDYTYQKENYTAQ
jgi:hypothetical protein